MSMTNRERHNKRRLMLEKREERAKRWLYTDDKPNNQALMYKFLNRRLLCLKS